MAGVQHFQFLQISVGTPVIYDGLGHRVDLGPTVPGTIMTQWADLPLARAWAAEAWRLVNDAAAIADLDSRTAREGLAYTARCGQAVMNFYNALNIPWWNDPEARLLYRANWAGWALGTVGAATTEFSTAADWNQDWFKPGLRYPRGKDFVGSYSNRVRQAFLGLYPRQDQAASHPIDLVFPALPVVIDPTNTGLGFLGPFGMDPALPADRGEGGVERAFALPGADSWYNVFPGSAPDDYFAPARDTRDTRTGLAPRSNILDQLGGNWERVRSSGTWNDIGIDVATPAPFGGEFDPNVPLNVAVPIKWVFLWLQSWAASLGLRAPEDVIVSSRVYAMWENRKWLAKLQDRYIEQVINAQATVKEQIDRVSVGAQAATSLLTGIGSGSLAIAGTGAAGPIGSAVLGVIGVASILSAQLVGIGARLSASGEVYGVYRDDIGRYKPYFERGWLSGNAMSAANPDMDAPALIIPAPPGWHPPNYVNVSGMTGHLLPIDAQGNPILGTQGALNPIVGAMGLSVRGTRKDNTLLWVAGGAAALYAGYRLLAR